MHKEPCSLPETTSRTVASDKPAEPVSRLEDLDRILGRRADAIEAEFREIAQVREHIRKQLLAAGGNVPSRRLGPESWGNSGANDLVT